MVVDVVTFPETRVAFIEHRGAPALEHETVRRLIAWKIESRLIDPVRHRSYGLHYTDPATTPPADHRVAFCLSIDPGFVPGDPGIGVKTIPRQRCARARDVGSRSNNQAARHLVNVWLPASGEVAGSGPMIFHYVNVGPGVREEDMVTDVYLPLG